jgi:cell division protein FtsN
MTDNQQSFYEIQLNTHHLLLAFIGALVVGVAVFYLGVVVGRSQGTAQPLEEWQAAVPADESAEDPLDFYESVQQPAAQPGDEGAAGETGEAEATAARERAQPAPTPVETAAPSTQPAAAAASMPESDPGLITGWVVQVKSTTDKQAADALQAALAREGFPAFVVSADVRNQTWHRVRVGRYSERADAEVVANRLGQRADIESTWVTEG